MLVGFWKVLDILHGTYLITKVKHHWALLVLGGVSRESTPGAVRRCWTCWYPSDHRSQANLGPVSTWTSDPREYAGGITHRTLSFRTRSFRPSHFVPLYISSLVILSPVFSSPGHFVPYSRIYRGSCLEQPLQNEKFHIHTLQKLFQASYFMTNE
jgi:hypothetical protein